MFLAGDLVQILAAHVAQHCHGGDLRRWLFPGAGGRPVQQNSTGDMWRRAQAAAGVRFRLHDLRHFFASGLIAAGCDVVTVQRALGHSSASITLNIYGHLWPTAEDRTRQAAAGLMAGTLTGTDDLGLRADGGRAAN